MTHEVALWGPIVITLAITGFGIWAYQSALGAWQSMLQPLSERVVLLEEQAKEQAATISKQTEEIRVLDSINARLQRELEESQRRVFALVLQLRNLGVLPNFSYYEQNEEGIKSELDLDDDE